MGDGKAWRPVDRTGERSEQDTFVAGGVPVLLESELLPAGEDGKPVVRIRVTAKAPVRLEVTGAAAPVLEQGGRP